MLLISCSQELTEESPVKNPGFSQNHVQGKITLNLRIDKKEISIAEQLELTLETSVTENIDVEFPSYSASLGDFTLKDVQVSSPRMTGTGNNVLVVYRVSYLLEPYLSGTYSIPAMTVNYQDKSDDTDVTNLVTGEMQIIVRSLLPPHEEQVDIRDIKPPLPLPANINMQILVASLVLLLIIAGFLAVLYLKKTPAKKVVAGVKLRPEEIAQQQLELLLAEDLLARGEVKLFHLRISDILRHYIENRFGLKAPEFTTEEFLTELSRQNSSENALLAPHKKLLTGFLSQCDLVKFAKHEPSLAESEQTVVICREFVEKTKEKVDRLKAEGR